MGQSHSTALGVGVSRDSQKSQKSQYIMSKFSNTEQNSRTYCYFIAYQDLHPMLFLYLKTEDSPVFDEDPDFCDSQMFYKCDLIYMKNELSPEVVRLHNINSPDKINVVRLGVVSFQNMKNYRIDNKTCGEIVLKMNELSDWCKRYQRENISYNENRKNCRTFMLALCNNLQINSNIASMEEYYYNVRNYYKDNAERAVYLDLD
eukprot:gene8443-268_t